MSGVFVTMGWERVIMSKSVDKYKGRTPLKNNQINRVGFAVLGKVFHFWMEELSLSNYGNM